MVVERGRQQLPEPCIQPVEFPGAVQQARQLTFS